MTTRSEGPECPEDMDAPTPDATLPLPRAGRLTAAYGSHFALGQEVIALRAEVERLRDALLIVRDSAAGAGSAYINGWIVKHIDAALASPPPATAETTEARG